MEIAPQDEEKSGLDGGMFGPNRKEFVGGKLVPKDHNGVDIKRDYGDPIYAMFDGTATKHKFTKAGFVVMITGKDSQGNEITVQTFHMQDEKRVSGEVKAGDLIGYQGNSGNLQNGIDQGTTESHVHIKVKVNGVTVDPLPYFKTEFDENSGEVLSSGCN